MHGSRPLFALLACLALSLAGCPGGDDGSSDAGDASGPGADADASVNPEDSGSPDDGTSDDGATNPNDADGGGPKDETGPDDGGTPEDTDGDEDGGGGCSSGLTDCDGSCVDLDSNADYCGDCNTSCSAAEVCESGSCVSRTESVVLSEVNNHPPRFVELYNGGTSPVNLQGWKVQWETGTATGSRTLPDYELGADEFVAVYSPDADVRGGDPLFFSDELPSWEHVGVRLLNASNAGADFVRTAGSETEPGPQDDWTATGDPPNPSPDVDQSLVRSVYEPDTDGAGDWHLTLASSAGSFCAGPGRCGTECVDQQNDRDNCGGCGVSCGSNQICREGRCTSANDHLWLTEYRRFPSPGVEIQNPTASSISIENYRLEVGSNAYTFPDRTLQPGEFLFVSAGDGNPSGGVLFSGMSASAFRFDQEVALLDETSTAIDFVRFGSSEAEAPSGTNWLGESVPSPSGADESAQRDVKVLDSDSNDEWHVNSPSNPGADCRAGKSSCSGKCVDLEVDDRHCGSCGNTCGDHASCVEGDCRSTGGVVISELRNDDPEFIEIYNGTASEMDLSGWKLDWSADNGSGSYTMADDTTLAAGDYLVFYEGSGNSGDDERSMETQVRWNSAISVALVDDSDSGVDFVRTGSESTSPPSGTSWSGDNTSNPGNGEVLVRDVYGDDSDTAADWEIRESASPGSDCSDSRKQCGSACVYSESPDHCGQCGRSCPTSDVCRDGTCDKLEGAVRLEGGGSRGYLEIHHDGSWGYVCDRALDDVVATVVCQQLGYEEGSTASVNRDRFEPYWVSIADCSGNETRFEECVTTWEPNDCNYRQKISCN